MNHLHRASVLALCLAFMAASCLSDPSRPCDPSLEALLPSLQAFPSGTGLGTPDRGVSVESQANPIAVCGTTASIPKGAVAVLNLYQFQDAQAAKDGYGNLAETAEWANPDFNSPVIPHTLQLGDLSPDDLLTACFTSTVDGDTTCRVLVRYANLVYWLSLSHLEGAGLKEGDLAPIMHAMEDNILASGQHP